MKICMMIDAWKPQWGGGQIHTSDLSRTLVERGHDVDLFTMNLDGRPTISNLGGFNVIRVGKSKSKFNIINRLKWCINVCRAIKKLNKTKQYDLIHAHANLAGLPGKIMSKYLGIPIVYTVHGSGIKSIFQMYGFNPFALGLGIFERFLQTGIIYDTEISVDGTFFKMKNLNKKIKVIHSAIDVNKFSGITKTSSKKFRFLFVGRLHPQKGISILLDTLSQIKNKLDGVEFIIVGSGPESNKLQAKSKTLKLNKLVKFTGRISDTKLKNYYVSSDCFILPSLFEGLPLTLLEAWSAKLPVLVTDVGEHKSLIYQGKDGFVIPSKNVEVLSKYILKIKDMTKTHLEKIGLNGYTKVNKNHTLAVMTNKILKVYRGVLIK